MSVQEYYSNSEMGLISLPARFDYVSSAQYRMPFAKLLGESGTDRIMVNFAGVTYVDSCGIGTLIAWHNTCQERGKKLVMQNCGDRIMEIFRMLAVDRLFVFHEQAAAVH